MSDFSSSQPVPRRLLRIVFAVLVAAVLGLAPLFLSLITAVGGVGMVSHEA